MFPLWSRSNAVCSFAVCSLFHHLDELAKQSGSWASGWHYYRLTCPTECYYSPTYVTSADYYATDRWFGCGWLLVGFHCSARASWNSDLAWLRQSVDLGCEFIVLLASSRSICVTCALLPNDSAPQTSYEECCWCHEWRYLLRCPSHHYSFVAYESTLQTLSLKAADSDNWYCFKHSSEAWW